MIGVVAIRLGDNSGLNAQLAQFYKLDGSRKLTGTMDANAKDIINIKDLSATGKTTTTDLVVNGAMLLAGASAPGSACIAGDAGKITKNTSGDGLVICNNLVWEIVGNVVTGITAGGACAVNNAFGTNATGLAFVCNGAFWTSLSNYANLRDVCAPTGRTATSSATNEQLVCRNGQYIKLASLLAKNVQVGSHLVVQDGTIVPKPACDLGGTANYTLTMTQSAVDVSTAPPYQMTYVTAQNNGASWTILMRLKRSAADGGGEASANAYGLTAVMTLECTY